MSTTEVAWRTVQAAHKLAWRVGFGRHIFADSQRKQSAQADVSIRRIAKAELRIDQVAKEAVIDCANVLVSGRWRVFDVEIDQLAATPDWFRDPLSGQSAPAKVFCFDIPYRRHENIGDVKYIWEMSRHCHLTLLAAAYFLTDDSRFANRVADHLGSWWRENPFLSGIHWTSGIEVGLRLIAWVWIRRLLNDWHTVKALFEDNGQFRQQLFDHQRYLRALRSHGSSANNHLIAEATGLYVSAVVFPLFEQSEAWRDYSAKLLEQENARQIDSDGMHRELAFEYHGFVIEMLLVAGVEADNAGLPLSDSYWKNVREMIDVVAATVDLRGNAPRQGDGDGGSALMLDAPNLPRWQSILATGRALFDAPSWWPPSECRDVRSAILSCLALRRTNLGPRRSKRPSHLSDSGTVILRDLDSRTDEIWCRYDVGPHGFLSIAAHAHADALAVELRHGGVDILADPGTYRYYCDRVWRHYFRSTIGHNTMEVDREDQGLDGGAFLWLTQPRTTLVRTVGLESGTTAECEGFHEGYARRHSQAVHHRLVQFNRAARIVRIIDWLSARQAMKVRLAFHLGPEVTCRLIGNQAMLDWHVSGDAYRGELNLPPSLEWHSVRGQKTPPLGWYSKGFGHIDPTTVLIGSGEYEVGRRLITQLRIFQDASSFAGQNAFA
jgi:hypothetical protein